jgi:hypothetical protein
MVVLVGHAFLLSSVCFDVDDVPNAEVNQVCRKFDGAMFWRARMSATVVIRKLRIHTFEAPLEHVARTRAITE